MNSDKAAAVRDSLNGCPLVANDEHIEERDPDREPFTTHRGKTYTGDRLRTNRARFRPAYIEQSGTYSDGGSERPVYVVILEPLWTEQGRDGVVSLSEQVVYEVAKHDCRVRVYPEDHRLGPAVWIVDHFSQDTTNTDGDRCACGSTYFKLRDGEPECARCGASREAEQQTLAGVTE